MAEIFCPTCGKSNPSDLEKCQFCGSRLKPFASSNLDVTPIKPGENPVIRETSEFEKVELTTSDLVHPGVEPTKKNTAALESTLPSWLRSLRKAEDSTEGKSTGDTSPDQHLPLSSSPEVAAESTDDKPDWLPETGKEIPDDEKDVPDWLASLREEKPDSSAQESISLQDRALNTTGSLSAGVADAEWMSRLGGEPKPETPQAIPGGDTQGEPESLDWLDSIGTESAGSSVGDNPATEQDDALHDWLSNLPPSSELDQSVSGEKEKLPDWQEPTQDKFVEPEPTPSSEKESPPDWQGISQVNFIEPKPTVSSGMEALPEWQNPPQEKIIEPEPTLGETGSTPVEPETPDWLSHLGSMPVKTEEQSEESVPDWLAALEPKPGPEPVTSSPVPAAEFSPASSEEIPSWLSQYQAEAAAAEQQESKKEQSESTPPSPLSREGTGPLPEWLVGIEKNPSASGVTPAVVADEEVSNSGETTGEGFSLEMPDWISKINPELASEKASGGVSEPPTPENLELSELPTWVQAMRPVESVMAETKESPQEKPQVTELTGPLAGLQGVLPVTPGLGTLRKPPAYSAILNVTEGQQRYAAAFEKMITGETQPQAAGKTRLTSNRVWRWVITFLLIAAVVAPLLTGIPATPASTIRPPETVNAFTLIGTLPSNSPVLVVFDYDPALSGEMEAAAAPLMDHLMLQGPRLALISTSPTGPALAERFLHDTNASPLIAVHNYQSGQQYVNLGYLAGGPSGIQYFASSPSKAAQFTLDGQQAWTLPPLQGVRSISDFAAIVVITDNADSGRVWIEQTGSTIVNTPILMVLSAQAEPMILPYYVSGQVKGLVTGLAGGDAYGQIFTRSGSTLGLAEKYWNSFGVGTLVAEILITIGAIWSAVAGWRSRRDKSGEKV